MANATVRLITGAVISGALLALYALVLVEAIQFARGASGRPPTEGAYWILQTIGGLVSALVTAQLALAPRPGDGGGARLFVLGGVPAGKAATAIALLYLAVWLALGFAAVVFGLVRYQQLVPPLADFAREWIGLALAASFAFFGIRAPA
jgi:hypothetical protein